MELSDAVATIDLPNQSILGLRVDVVTYEGAARHVLGWAREGTAAYVCAANVHMVMEAYDSVDFRRVVNGAGLVTADGMPLVWGLRLLGERGATRVDRRWHAARVGITPVGGAGCETGAGAGVYLPAA
jgi:N-acetylglucosaminyldiphosphoundecaprenol N-acetyl-beta-D-mannosaminyltransferase